MSLLSRPTLSVYLVTGEPHEMAVTHHSEVLFGDGVVTYSLVMVYRRAETTFSLTYSV
jgi:hypothetical protein